MSLFCDITINAFSRSHRLKKLTKSNAKPRSISSNHSIQIQSHNCYPIFQTESEENEMRTAPGALVTQQEQYYSNPSASFKVI